MCLFGKSPAWEDDIVFANRRHGKKHRTRVTETIVERNPKYVPPPRPRTPRPATPSIRSPTPSPSPPPPPRAKKPEVRSPPPQPQAIIELVSVEEDRARSSKGKGRRGNKGEEVYIERERVRERLPREEYDTFRYVEAPAVRRESGGGVVEERKRERERERSITYQSNPRLSGRVTERERVVVEDGGRRREYYRKP